MLRAFHGSGSVLTVQTATSCASWQLSFNLTAVVQHSITAGCRTVEALAPSNTELLHLVAEVHF